MLGVSLELWRQIAFAFIAAAAICAAGMPIIRIFAHRIGAIDVPKDDTRMHDFPIPRLGGLAMFVGFVLAVVLFSDVTRQLQGMLIGAVIIVVTGVLDDILTFKWYIKLIAQIAAAVIAVLHGIVIEYIMNPIWFAGPEYLRFGLASVPITVFWMILMTNAVNLIDGLDGLAAGVSGIACISLVAIALIMQNFVIAVIAAALLGSCVGFLPYNFHPNREKKMLMGDTGALMLGFILANLSIIGLFKFYAIISFAVPFLIVGLPLFDTAFAFLRRILKGQHPMHRDRGHLHHRLIDLGLSQKKAVLILYAFSAVLGFAAVVITTTGELNALILLASIIAAVVIISIILRSKQHKK